MPRVKIGTPGVTVEIDADEESAKDLTALALAVFKDAGGWPQTEHHGIGFAAAERRSTPTHSRDRFREVGV